MTTLEWFQWSCVGWTLYDIIFVLPVAVFKVARYFCRRIRRSLWWLRLQDALKGIVDE